MKIANLCKICSPKQWKTISTDMLTSSGYPVYGANGVIGYYSEFNHENETLLITCRGATCGTLNICNPFSYVTGNAMALDNLDSDIDIKYLYYYLLHRGFSDIITGSAQPQIVRQSLEKVIVSYPDLKIQKAITSKLDKISNLIILREQQLEKLDELGKARFVETFGDPDDNNYGWKVVSLGSLFSVGSSKRIYQSEQVPNGIPFLRISDLIHRIDDGSENAELYISEVCYKELKENGFVPSPGDILVTSRGTLGKCYEIKEEDKFYFQDGMISWLYNRNLLVTNAYIMHLFKMPGFRRQIDEVPAGSTVNYLSLSRLRELQIMCPPIEQQNQFAVFVEQTNKSKLTIQQGLDKLELMKKALMQEYFG